MSDPGERRNEQLNRLLRQTETGNGQIFFCPDFKSKYVQPRNLSIWLPPGYRAAGQDDYRVIYAHDGQNLFDPQTAFVGVDWGLHEALCRLLAAESIQPTLVVGIWNTPERYPEYDPQQVFSRYLSTAEQKAYVKKHGQPVSDSYLKFIVEELKPSIDAYFRTRPGRRDTFLLGSSMGGLISAYGLCEYPDIFGGAACLSTHWPAGHGKMISYLRKRLPDPQSHLFYFDYGTETIDAQYEPFQQQVDDVMRCSGYDEGCNWLTRKFIGEDHSEWAWRRRIDIPLQFLLK